MPDPRAKDLLSSVPSRLDLLAEAKLVEFAAAKAGEEGEQGLPRFEAIAYTGREMRIDDFYYPVVVELKGITVPAGSHPALRQHNPMLIVGHSDSITINGSIKVAGVVSGTGEAAREVVADAANGFPWRISIGMQLEKVIRVDEDEKVTVNGRKFTGPLFVARKSTFAEIAFVPIGADRHTSARITADGQAASAKPLAKTRVLTMKFDEWLQAKGFGDAELSDAQTASLHAMFEAEGKPAATALLQVGEPVKPEPPKPATFDELTAALPQADEKFICAQLKDHATLEQAKGTHVKNVQSRLEAAEEKLAKAEKHTAKPGLEPLGGISASGEGGPEPLEGWPEAVAGLVKTGLTKAQAVSRVAREQPELRAAYVVAYNESRGQHAA